MTSPTLPEPVASQDIDWSTAASWYDRNANVFELSTRDSDLSEMHDIFLDGLPRFARVLDAGCGAGRDLRSFARLGHQAEGFDASHEMVRAARAHSGRPVRHLDFARYHDPEGRWDGIWAMASLLHVPLAEMQDTLRRLMHSLTTRGRLLVSVKAGQGEVIDERGRPMSYLDIDGLSQLLFAACPGKAQLRAWTSVGAASNGAATEWTNALILRLDDT